MVVMIEKRRIELHIRGSHAPPCAEEQARATLRACSGGETRATRQSSEGTMQQAGTNRSQCMAEIIVTKYGPHG
jgi:hypothetical protein